jgi:hypothetical protein
MTALVIRRYECCIETASPGWWPPPGGQTPLWTVRGADTTVSADDFAR